jgi:DNA polymerase elongation subunit (family B)
MNNNDNQIEFKYRGDNADPLKNNKSTIRAKITDWYCSNEIISDNGGSSNSDSESEENEKPQYKKIERQYVIRIFATTKKGTSIGINVFNYTPHFYMKVPEEVAKAKNKQLSIINAIKTKMSYSMRNNLLGFDIIRRKNLYGFSNNTMFPFLRMIFKDTTSMNGALRVIREHNLSGRSYKGDIFESNIPPFLRFIHKNNIEPAGWINIAPGNYTLNLGSKKLTKCQVDISVDNWKKVKSFNSEESVPFLTAVFDLECNSSHGDFPLAKKNYKKPSQELFEYSQKNKDSIEEDDIYNMLLSAFMISNGNEDNKTEYPISRIFTRAKAKPPKKFLKFKARQIFKTIQTRETYAILAKYLIENFLETDEDILEEIDESHITNIVCDSFADCPRSECETGAIRTFTKSNMKPTKRVLHNVSMTASKILRKCVKQLIKIVEDEKLVYNILIGTENVNKDTDDKTKKDADTTLDTYINALISLFKTELPELDTSRETGVNRIIEHFEDHRFPEVLGDEIIQIGTAVQRFGTELPVLKHIITLDTCDPIPGAIVEQYKTEREVILAWIAFVKRLDPDLISGYNIFGFDFSYLYHRAEDLGLKKEIDSLGRVKRLESNLEVKKLSSSALGDNTLYYINMHGRVLIDLLKVVQRDHNLVSYKLDHVAENFINDKILEIVEVNEENNTTKMKIKGHTTLVAGNFITINYISKQPVKEYIETKYKIIEIVNDTLILDSKIYQNKLFNEFNNSIKWQLAKDDVSPQQIFEFQGQNATKRAIVASYCIQDCALCITLMNKLDIITNNVGMANVCFVPLSFIFLRGQGIKIFSLVSKECKNEDYLVPLIKHSQEETRLDPNSEDTFTYDFKNKFTPGEDLDDGIKMDDEGGYEGAIVLKPNPGIYLKKPVTVLDYASLYPSSMISENLSHDSLVIDEKYLGTDGAERLKELGYDYVDVTHDTYKWINPRIKSKGKVKCGQKTCRFVQPPENEKSIIPRILKKLLKARKDTRAKIKTTEDPFKKKVYDGLQLAYKLTANSLYGQIGAPTSAIYLKDIAASTTAVGRNLLHLAKDKTLEHYPQAEIVYGDTDSVFINFNPTDDKTGKPLEGKAAIEKSIEMGVGAEKYIQQFLKAPHRLEYEKTFSPFILFSKKRYIGNKYEEDAENYKQTSMGIVLKRRDNADIVKHVYGTIIDILINKLDLEGSIKFCQEACSKLLQGKFPMDMLVITKSLRGFYKNPDQIAHKVLADRIGEREPGNKPKSNDRIPFVYIETKASRGAKVLQGDKIENPDYIKKNSIKPDYKFYITNQIMKPVGQIYALTVENLPGYNKPKDYFDNKYNSLLSTKTPEKAAEKVKELRFNEATDLIFGEVLRVANNKRDGAREITDFFSVKKRK